MVLKTCKWYPSVRLVMTRRLLSSMTFLGQILKLTYLSRSLCNIMLFVMTSGDLNIDLTQKNFEKVVGLSTYYQTLLAVCRYDSWFSRSEGGRRGPPPESEPFRARPE